MNVRLSKIFTFEAAHLLPTFPPGHKCRRLHGHSYRVEVVVEGEADESRGYLLDFGRIEEACEPVRRQLDHTYLNEVEGLENPTSEVLARWIWQQLSPALPGLAAVIVAETCTSRCEYRGS